MSISPKDRGAHILGAGLTLAATVILLSFGGSWLDGELGTTPLFLLLGAFLGAVGGFIHLIWVVAPDALPFGKSKKRKIPKRDDDGDAAGSSHAPDP